MEEKDYQYLLNLKEKLQYQNNSNNMLKAVLDQIQDKELVIHDIVLEDHHQEAVMIKQIEDQDQDKENL